MQAYPCGNTNDEIRMTNRCSNSRNPKEILASCFFRHSLLRRSSFTTAMSSFATKACSRSEARAPESDSSFRLHPSAFRRPGFTLIEMLVVVGIICFLTAALVIVIPRVVNASKVASTRATIQTVDTQLNDRINGFRRWINKQNLIAGSGPPSYLVNSPYASMWSQNGAAAKILAVKYWFARSFPQQFSEVITMPPNYNPASNKPTTQSAACLYMILTQTAIFDTEPPAGVDLKGYQVADTDGDGLLEIVDAWGQPVRFYRWPTRLTRPNYNASNTGAAPTGFVDVPPPQPPFTSWPTPPYTSWSALLYPTPLTLAMSGAAPRTPLLPWAPSVAYPLGAMIALQPNAVQVQPFSLVYQCVASGTSGTTAPTWPTTPVVGQTVSDGTAPNAVTWQAVLDPLSLDPDDPLGIVYAYGQAINQALITESNGNGINETPNTWNNPLIVSMGTDGLLGLYEPYDTQHFGNFAQPLPDPTGTDPTTFMRSAMYDNITNHQR
jgi:prepilin-type N-terminal cleavage/methylation domain-containing protein